jgi:hypothetical protein
MKFINKHFTRRFSLLFIGFGFVVSHILGLSTTVLAYDADFYSSNSILFYDPRSLCGDTSGGGTVGTILSGDSIEEKVWNFLVTKGLTAEQTAGVMGNISHESGFRPDAVEGGNGIGFGLVQWSFGRRTALEQAAAQAGKNPSDLSFQLDYLYEELSSRGVNYSKYQGKGYTSEWDGLTKQSTVEDAVVFFHHEFEVSYLINFDKPGYVSKFHDRTYPSADAAVIGERGGIDGPTGHPGAQYYFNTYSGSTGGGSDDECSSGGVTADISFDMEKLFEDSSGIQCAPGTNDTGVDEAYNRGQPYTARLCEVTNSVESGKGRGALVNSRVSGAVFEMFKKMGEDLGVEKIPINSSFRTYEDQADAYARYGSPQAAAPGWSNHQSGVAIDFGEGGCAYKAGITSCSSNRFWVWLTANASQYQFQQLSNEWWHWSPNGA